MNPGDTLTLTTGERVTVAAVHHMRRLLQTTTGAYIPLRLVPGYQPPTASDRLAGADLRRSLRDIARECGVSSRTAVEARRAAGIVVPNRGRPRKGTLWPPALVPGTEVPVADVLSAWAQCRDKARPYATVARRLGLTTEQVRAWVN